MSVNTIEVRIYEFKIMGNKIFHSLSSDNLDKVRIFYQYLNSKLEEQVYWSEAVLLSVYEAIKIEFPYWEFSKIELFWEKTPYMFLRGNLMNIVNELERNSGIIKAQIREQKINNIIK